MNIEAFQATARFGLGTRRNEKGQDEMAMAASDPRGWLTQQLVRAKIPPSLASITGYSEATNQLVDLLQAKQQKKQGMEAAFATTLRDVRNAYIQETGTRFLAQMTSDQPFVERLVMFWSNHFTVSIQKPLISGVVNAFEVQAIRPHVTGKFVDMLVAAEKHPAMLFYLDNLQSMGAQSMAGQRRNKGLNENLAREILELHTLGVNGGYTQTDVIALANIITGWSVNREDGFSFVFQQRIHQPGNKVLLGRTYGENGVGEGELAMINLSRHPATALHIATKLARHFISDNPPERAIRVLEKTFRDTDGDLMAVSRALISLDECWVEPLAKFKTPYEFALSALRLTGITPTPQQVLMGLESLNYRVFNAPSPAGFPDVASSWASSDGILKRIEWARALSQRVPEKTDPLKLADAAFGPVMRDETRFIIKGAETGRDGLAFLLSSPEFQRR